MNKGKEFLLGAALVGSLMFPTGATQAHSNKGNNNNKTKIENTTAQPANYNKKYKIDTYADIEKLFDASLQLIFCELILEENFINHAYDDYGKYHGAPNTICCGSTYAPKIISNYDDTTTAWLHVHRNPNTFHQRLYTPDEALELIIGWAKYRQRSQNPETGNITKNATILKRMFNGLRGTELNQHEFSALFCAVYNNESNITRLCPYIRDHHNDKFACANKIRTWTQSNGLRNRSGFESLVYLNADGFCDQIGDYPLCPRKHASAIYTESTPTELTRRNYKSISNNYKKQYLSTVYSNGRTTPNKICQRISCVNFNTVSVQTTESTFQKRYDNATILCKKGQFERALDEFLKLEADGALGCDLLNDIAYTYEKLKNYDKTIEYSRKVLKTSEYGEYAKACYNAGKAYEKNGNTERALVNYTQALKYYKQYGISSPDPNTNYEEKYQECIDRVKNSLEKTEQHPDKANKKTDKKNHNLTPWVFVAGGAILSSRKVRKKIRSGIQKISQKDSR